VNDARKTARRLAAAAIAAGKPLDWFEQLYAGATTDGLVVPWADRRPNPNLIELYEKVRHLGLSPKALKVGCGLGDDAEWLSEQGFDVTAFDISPSAIGECSRRFPRSRVCYLVADLFAAPSAWTGAFDVVQESYTLQVLPAEIRGEAMRKICGFIAPGGYMLFVCRGREPSDPPGSMPWPLTRDELAILPSLGLSELIFEDYLDREDPPVRRFRACYRRDV
jgi:ubiquinone/menaquinone biosynthesis C-methylase UbiE